MFKSVDEMADGVGGGMNQVNTNYMKDGSTTRMRRIGMELNGTARPSIEWKIREESCCWLVQMLMLSTG